ncbi:MAG: hypothetical protein JXN61_04950 [Sedimentisphaerales bacterium]|nr:hypothetical protein [Sedimentisphaerales bacterium]
MQARNLKTLTIQQLLQLHGESTQELRRRGVVRSANNPLADYAEFLVCCTLRLSPAGPSTKGFDATDASGNRYEIKARRRAKGTEPTRFSALRDFEGGHFRYVVLVLFADDYTIERAAVLTVSAVRKRAFYQKHVNGWIIPLNDRTWAGVGVRDVSRELRIEQTRLKHRLAADYTQRDNERRG